MHILLLNWRDPKNPRSGGAEYVTMMHAKAWVNQGDTVTWLAASYSGAKQDDLIDGVYIIRKGNPLTVFIHAYYYFLFHRKNIDLIVDEVHGIPYFAALYTRKPVVLFIHEVAGNIWQVMYSTPVAAIGRFLERIFLWIYRRHLIWTDAASTIDELVRLGASRSRCIAIPCPSGMRSLDRAPVKSTVPTFIFVGRLVRMKRIDHVLAAFGHIRKALPQAKLRIVGEGSQKGAPGVTWYGRVSEKRKVELLRTSHILLHASIKEGWGLVVLEAASQWTPSVVYRVPGLVDTVRDGRTGVVVDANPQKLAEAAVSLYNDQDRYRRMQRGAADYNNVFMWNTVVKESRMILLKAYEERR